MAFRDLKPENTLVDTDGYCKMIDMGFAKVIKGKSYTFCGTPEYLAPEIILGTGHNQAVDYFALGVLIYEMICGQTPFFDFQTDGILKNIVRGKLRFGPKFTAPLKDIITVCTENSAIDLPRFRVFACLVYFLIRCLICICAIVILLWF
jgi:serine/threonine protein kinase